MPGGVKVERVSPLVVDNIADPIEASDYIPVFHLSAPAIPQSLAGRLPYRPDPVVHGDDPIEGLEERQIGADRIVWLGGGVF